MTDQYLKPIYNRYRGGLITFAAQMVGWDFAEDVVQETFVRFYNTFDENTDHKSIRRWLWMVTRSEALRFLKKESTRTKSNDAYLERMSDEDFIEAAEIYSELASRVEETLKQLPFSRKRIVAMKLKGIDFPEIAELLKVNVNTVRVQWSRFRDAVNPKRERNTDGRLYYYDGQWKSLSQWANAVELDANVVRARIRAGDSIEKALRCVRNH